MNEVLRQYQDALGLTEWILTVSLVPAPGGDAEREGYSVMNIRYLTAQIELNETMSDEGQRVTLLHEVVHILLASIEQAHQRIMDLVPMRMRDHAEEIWNDGVEQSVERVTRVLRYRCP